MTQRAVVTEQVRIQDLKPGDVIDTANYRYRPTANWSEVVEVRPFEGDDSYVVIVVKGKDQNYLAMSGMPVKPLDLVTVQVVA